MSFPNRSGIQLAVFHVPSSRDPVNLFKRSLSSSSSSLRSSVFIPFLSSSLLTQK